MSRFLSGRLMKSIVWLSAWSMISLVTGFWKCETAPSRRLRSRSSSAEMMWIGMWRVSRVVLEPVEHHPALVVGQVQVERDGGGMQLARQGDPAVDGARHDGLEAFFPREVAQDAGEVRVVLDDEQDEVVGLELGPVVLDRGGLDDGRGSGAAGFGAAARGDRLLAVGPRRRLCPGEDGGEIKREGAALAGLARHLQAAAEQRGQFAADGKAQARSRRTCARCPRRPAGRPRRRASACRPGCRCRCR